CSSAEDAGPAAGEEAEASDPAVGEEAEAPAVCDQEPTVDPVVAVPVAGAPSDVAVTSFDGTSIRAHWFPVGAAPPGVPAPTVLMGPGWGAPGATPEATSAGPPAAMTVGRLNAAGYNVLTWDPRGFGRSGGTVTVNDPEHEGRDVQVLLDWVAARPEAALDRAGDPRAGMVGGSYGGGIQLTVASLDCRVDALVPTMAWHSLETSLYRNETLKAGWLGLLGASSGPATDPHLARALRSGLEGQMSSGTVDWLHDRGPGDAVARITAPTLLVAGSVDTLFTPTEAFANFEALRDAGTTVAMAWYCGGHGVCLTGQGDPALMGDRTMAWLDRHLRGGASDTGPVVDVIDQQGQRWIGDDLPDDVDQLEAHSEGGILALDATSVAGPVAPVAGTDVLTAMAASLSPARADRAVEVTATSDAETLVLGAPQVTMTYRGTSPDGTEPTRVFAQVVDDATGVVLGNQITPVPLTLDGTEHRVEVDLEVVAHHLAPRSRVTLQIVATTPGYATPRLGGTV
ncbi:MAG TPA: alpha/beta fold hydrolase, partial [Acidimicrobiales bacterium]|nr:alpha/beta fold hydrolase [Acidimicrobiales bacterium]